MSLLLPLLFAAQTFASSPPAIEDIPSGEDVIASLRKGQTAPFDGQLFDANTAIRWGHWLQQYKAQLALLPSYYEDSCAAQVTYQGDLLAIEKSRAAANEKSFTEALRASEEARLAAEETARNPPWYSTTEFGIVLGVVGSAAILGLSIWALEARTE